VRIIVATSYTIPAFSGGWTTPLDLLGSRHQAMYVVRNLRAGTRTIEGVKCVGAGSTGCLAGPWPRANRYRHAAVQWLFMAALKRSFHKFNADLIICLDPDAGYVAMKSHLPYAMRFHSRLSESDRNPLFDRLMKNAVFATCCPETHVPGVEVLAHNQDLSRFEFAESRSAKKAILLTSIDRIHEPELFIEGIMLSKTMRGDIVGAGSERERIAGICAKTGGRVRCLPPVPRLEVPGLLKNYQTGVATVLKVSPVVYQMKVNAYMASGLYTLAKPWTHIVHEAPDLVSSFVTAQDLAYRFDWLSENWMETLETRRKARDWIHKNYSMETPRKRFNQILKEHFPNAD
jgi:hypothetical protein